MGRPRLELHDILGDILGDKTRVYFQPPMNHQLIYPCIVYKRDYARTQFAGNNPYRYTKRYQVMIIDRNPDSSIPDEVAKLPMCIFDRFYTANDLNHDVFNVYF